jgi:hypothetical protein
MPDITNIPAQRVQVVDDKGLMTRQWYRYLFNLFSIAGAGESPISNTDMLLAPDPVANNPNVLSYGPSYPMGYGNGAGGVVTQATSRTTGVTVARVCGQITLFSTTTTAGTFASFTVTNTTVSSTDVVIVNFASGATANSYGLAVTAVAAGSFRVQIHNIAAVGVAEAPVINFAVIKAVAV